MNEINISVRGLVEFVLRGGDIDNRRKASSGPEIMLEGANIHRMIQRKMGKTYHPEVYLCLSVQRSDYVINIDGRADGIIIPTQDNHIEEMLTDREEDNIVCLEGDFSDLLPAEGDFAPEISDDGSTIVIDEIKTTYRDLDRLTAPDEVHLAQARCYAYIVALKCKLSKIAVRMTYVNTETRDIRYFDSTYSFEEISAWFMGVMKQYVRWADFEMKWRGVRDAGIEAMTFPYEYRPGQKELISQVYKSITNKERLFVMAPTGVGKTLANMYPALKALPQKSGERIFYLTAKTITRTVASDCLNLLRKDKLRAKSVILTAKEKICLNDCVDCNPDKCQYAKGHFDRINDAMYDLLINEDDFSRENITEYAIKHKVCPFEFSLDMSLFSDVIICDYNYVFDPNVYLRRFFSEGVSGKYLFLIDEAHNLVDRAMEMYSAELRKEDFLEIKRLVKDVEPKLARAIESCNKFLLSLKRECEDIVVYDDIDAFAILLLKMIGRIEQFLDDFDHFEHNDELLEFYFGVKHFLNIHENMDKKDYVMYTQLEENGDFYIHLMCANPAKNVRKCTDKAAFTSFFSATLLPIDYYRQMLGASPEDNAVYAKSVFDERRRKLLIASDVTSKYTRRCDSEYDKMAEYISEIVSKHTGNYMIFCPSFSMMERVSEMYINRYYDENTQEILLQSQSMTEEMREEFLERFRTVEGSCATGKSLLGFTVLGGIFSEGIDLKNDALIGAIIIGNGFPMVCARRQLLKNCYDEMGLDGFNYAYRFPGLNKVLQAAGRVIRTEEDMGVVALLDERFLGRDYNGLFPREWAGYTRCRISDVGESVQEFWNNY